MESDKTQGEMLEKLNVMLNEDVPYGTRLEAYEYLMEDCEPILDEMIKRSYELDGETGKMLMEILAGYKGNDAIFMGLVSYLYKGDDVALFARLIGGYGDERGVEVLKGFLREYEPNYNEFMEIRNAIEELGGDCEYRADFSEDPFFRYLKGLDEPDEESRRSPFFGPEEEDEDIDDGDDCCDHGDECCHCDEDDCDDDCGHDGCHCHHCE